jgi:beta-lactamase class A
VVRAWTVVFVLLLACPAEARMTTAASIRAAKEFIQARAGDPSFAVITERGRLRGWHKDRTYPAASVAKAMLLVAVLRDARHRALTGEERSLVGPMIHRSSNKTARVLFARYGSLALERVAQLAHMRYFDSRGTLFEGTIAARDQARFFLGMDRLIPKRHRAYARGLLSGIKRSQRWGIPPAAAAHHLRIFFKGGWRRGITHQVARLERTRRRRIAVAVLTRSPNRPYGEATIEGVARRLLAPPASFWSTYRPLGGQGDSSAMRPR